MDAESLRRLAMQYAIDSLSRSASVSDRELLDRAQQIFEWMKTGAKS